MIISRGSTVIQDVKYLYIDGGYFNGILNSFSKDLFDGTPIEVDYSRIGQGYKRVFFYDSLPGRMRNESDEEFEARRQSKSEELSKIARTPGFHLREGVVRREGERRNTQKKVDVLLAVDALTHAWRGNMGAATFLTGDLDFQPVIDALVSEGTITQLWYEPTSASEDLILSVDTANPINFSTLRTWMTEEFQEGQPIPRAHFGSPPEGWASSTRMQFGRWEDGRAIEIKHVDGELWFVRGPDPGGNNLCVHGENWPLMEKYIRNVHGDFELGVYPR